MNKPRLNSILILALIFPFCASHVAQALPDDKYQQGLFDGKGGGLTLKDGITTTILTGEERELATFIQGSLKISGTEMIIERAGKTLLKITVTGSPANFQQRPELDQEIVYGTGNILVFNNTEQTLTIDNNAEFTQGDSAYKGHHIDYNINTEELNFSADSNDNDDRILITIPATPEP